MASETNNNERIIAIWGKCDVSICETPESEEMPSSGLNSVGKIEDKTTVLSYTDGESQELKGTGGETIDQLDQEGKLVLETVVVEPTTLYKTLGLSDSTDADISGGKVRVKQHVVDKRYAVKLTPQRVGGWGIEAPVCSVAIAPAGEEAKGGSLKLRFTIIKGKQDYLYDKVKKPAPAPAG